LAELSSDDLQEDELGKWIEDHINESSGPPKQLSSAECHLAEDDPGVAARIAVASICGLCIFRARIVALFERLITCSVHRVACVLEKGIENREPPGVESKAVYDAGNDSML
jgi:hypothetical protein